MTTSTSVDELREEILRAARVRQASIERGQYEVPLCYTALPLEKLLDFQAQLEYRRDALALAVPPPGPGIGARLTRLCKNLVCSCLRWLFIRQVEFNTAAIRYAQALAELAAVADRNQAELVAGLTNLKLQVQALAERTARWEGAAGSDSHGRAMEPPVSSDSPIAHRAYLEYLKDEGPVLVLGSGHGDLLRYLISEGVHAQGVERDASLVEFCRERELPIVLGDSLDFVKQFDPGALGGIILLTSFGTGTQELAQLMRSCWLQLKKGAALIVETATPQVDPSAEPGLPVELVQFILESQCFTVMDCVFSQPLDSASPPLARSKTGQPFDLRNYRTYAVVGRK